MIDDEPIYLAGGINGLSDADAMDWRAEATALLGGPDKVLDPMARDYRGKEDENVDQIVEGDKDDIEASRAVIVYAARPSWGTAMEVLYAWEAYKRVIVVVPDGPVSPWLRYHATAVVRTVAEAVEAVR